MKLKQMMAGATIAGAVGAAVLGAGTGIASAAPGPQHGAPAVNHAPAPQEPGGGGGHGPGAPGGPGGGGPGGGGPGGPGDHGPGGPGGWHGDDHRGYFHGAPWGDGPAPWGAGEPPHPNWNRPLPPPGGRWNDGPINYYGYNENPIWNPGFNQWGFDFFGVWIPL